MTTKLIAVPTLFMLATALLCASPATADDAPQASASIAPIDVPPLPNTISNEEMAELSSDTNKIVFDETRAETEAKLETLNLESPDPEASEVKTAGLRTTQIQTAGLMTRASMASSKCFLVPGNMWLRKSSNYGGVGSKPSLRNCSANVVKTGMASEVFRQEWWGWQKVVGPFNSYGTSSMQSKDVTYWCNGKTRDNRFQVITTAWGTTSRGQTGVGRDSTGSYTFKCN